jgi:hypothetical protein
VCASGLVGKRRMSNARVHFEMNVGRRTVPTTIGGGEVPAVQYIGEERSSRRVLNMDRTLCTLVLEVHEEVVNQYSGMAYFGGIFSDGEVSVRAVDYILEHPYPMKATLDVVGFWNLRGFSRFSVVHLVLIYINQCFGC